MADSFHLGARSSGRTARTRYSYRRAAGAIILVPALLTVRAALPNDGPAQPTRSTAPIAERIIFMQIPLQPKHSRDTWRTPPAITDQLPDGSRIVLHDPADPRGDLRRLTTGFASAGRPDLSFDGQRMLFVGKQKATDRLAVWEIGLDRSDLRKVISPPGDCISAIYLSTMYAMGVEQPVLQIAFCCRGPDDDAVSIYTCRMDGTHPTRITFTPGGAFDPYLLSDGRLLFSAWQNSLSTPSLPAGAPLFSVNTDGTDVALFAGEGPQNAARSMICETAAGFVYYVESDRCRRDHPCDWDRGGTLVRVSRARNLHTRQSIAHQPRGRYHSPTPLDDHRLLVSYRLDDSATYGLYALDPRNGARLDTVIDDPHWHDVHARVVTPRPQPAGRSSLVDQRVETGILYCLDAYLTGTQRAGDGEQDRIDRVRVISLTSSKIDPASPASSAGAKRADSPGVTPTVILAAPQIVLAELPVEADGSFHLQVPARTPMRLQTLSSAGTVLMNMRSWIWVMPKEKRGCVGCHEDRELAPPNRYVTALRKPPGVVEPARNQPAVTEKPK